MKRTEQLTNEEVYVAASALARLMDTKMQERAAYWLGRNADSLDRLIKAAQKSKDRLIRKYGTADEKGNVAVLNFIDKTNEAGEVIKYPDGRTEKIKNPVVDDFNEEWEAVLGETVELSFFPIPLSLLVTSKGERIDFSPKQFRGAGFMFSDIEEVKNGNS